MSAEEKGWLNFSRGLIVKRGFQLWWLISSIRFLPSKPGLRHWCSYNSIAERFPSALIVGIDRSKYLLSRLEKKKNVLTVLGDIPYLPFKKDSFDIVGTVQVLHEILHFKGADALVRTLQKVCGLLKKDGW